MILCSGGFDPLHVGHVRYLIAAGQHDDVAVALNSDAWLYRKKGYAFMPWDERREILAALGCAVFAVDDADGTVCEAIRRLRPRGFGKGGDRTGANTPEAALCAELGIPVLYGLGGEDKPASSSALVERQWGFYEVLAERPSFKVKRLVVMPGRATSLQRHARRNEHWIATRDQARAYHGAGDWHQLRNDGAAPLEVIEVQTGSYFGEDDIERAAGVAA